MLCLYETYKHDAARGGFDTTDKQHKTTHYKIHKTTQTHLLNDLSRHFILRLLRRVGPIGVDGSLLLCHSLRLNWWGRSVESSAATRCTGRGSRDTICTCFSAPWLCLNPKISNRLIRKFSGFGCLKTTCG